MKTIFGPVPSRRLGRSLGIDVIPPKTCSYDCVYCESGRTTHLTVERQCFVAPERVLEDLDEYFREHPRGADALTLSSAGEPTLYAALGDLLRSIKRRFPSLPLVVLTNGSLLWQEQVRRDLVAADRVVPSLDAATVDSFNKLNRPHPALELSRILEGLKAFRKEYRGQLHLEVMLVAGYNDHPAELNEICRVIDRLHPDRIELNTVVRPPARAGVRGLSDEAMQTILRLFPSNSSQIIGRFSGSCDSEKDSSLGPRVLKMVRRRPCTIPEMASSLGVAEDDLKKVLSGLEHRNLVTRSCFDGLEYICSVADASC